MKRGFLVLLASVLFSLTLILSAFGGGYSLDPHLRDSALTSIGFNGNIQICIYNNSVYGWEFYSNFTGIIGGNNIPNRRVAAYLAGLKFITYPGHKNRWKPTQVFLSEAKVTRSWPHNIYCVPAVERDFGKITYLKKWTATRALGKQSMIAFTFIYSMSPIFGKPVEFGKFKGNIVMTLDIGSGKWEIVRAQLSDGGIRTFYKYLKNGVIR